MVLKALTRAIKQTKEVKRLQIGKKSNIRDPKNFTKKNQKLSAISAMWQDTESTLNKSIAFYAPTMSLEKKVSWTFTITPRDINRENKIPRTKPH